MSRSLEILAMRKQVLVARASVERLRMAQQLGALREDVRIPRLARAAVRSTRTRAAFFTLLLMVAGRGRVARWVRRAAVAVSVAGVVHSMLRRAPRSPEDEAASLPAERA